MEVLYIVRVAGGPGRQEQGCGEEGKALPAQVKEPETVSNFMQNSEQPAPTQLHARTVPSVAVGAAPAAPLLVQLKHHLSKSFHIH